MITGVQAAITAALAAPATLVVPATVSHALPPSVALVASPPVVPPPVPPLLVLPVRPPQVAQRAPQAAAAPYIISAGFAFNLVGVARCTLGAVDDARNPVMKI